MSKATIWGLSKKKANYRPAQQAEVRCDHCVYMFPPWRSVGATWSAG